MSYYKAPMSKLAEAMLADDEGRRLLWQALRDCKPFTWRGEVYRLLSATMPALRGTEDGGE
jgi:hypothetical protein